MVVNEVQTAGATSATDEFVELFNPCSVAVDLAGFALNYRSAMNNGGAADVGLFIFGNETTIGAEGFILIAGSGFPGPAAGRIPSGGLAAAGGAVAIRNSGGQIVDSVAYEMLTAANAFTEGMPALNPSASTSIGRRSKGLDTNNNLYDFTISLTPTPGTPNP